MENTDYEKLAQDFLDATGTTIAKEFWKRDLYFPSDKESRNIRNITLKNKWGSYTFTFGDSVHNSHNPVSEKTIVKWYRPITKSPTVPNNYNILSCLDVIEGDFEEFCSNFGYDTDSIQAEKTYKACLDQSNNLRRLFDRQELEILQEIN